MAAQLAAAGFRQRLAVVHSFDGSAADARAIMEFSPTYYVGVNGCSLREPGALSVIQVCWYIGLRVDWMLE